MVNKISSFFIIIFILLVLPGQASALIGISDLEPQIASYNVAAAASIVVDAVSGEVVHTHNADMLWIPASLTKLVTAMVVLDSNSKWNATCAIIGDDEVGGARLVTYRGAKYKIQDLFTASILASANNATNALARCTGIPKEDFIAKMNAKAAALGAANTKFVDMSGMSIENSTTASDMVKITQAAFSNKKIQEAALKKTATITTYGSKPFKTHKLNSTNLLLKEAGIATLGGKTGYLEESQYNFAGVFKLGGGKQVVTVVLGSPAKVQSFADTKFLLAFTKDKLAWRTSFLSFVNETPTTPKAFTMN